LNVDYVGEELELFARAVNWKRYLRAQVEPFIRGDVLEVGAGLGGTTQALSQDGCATWTCLEPDAKLAAAIERGIAAGDIDARCRVEVGTLADVDLDLRFDTILYIDVLEHIEDDRAEVRAAVERLRPGGTVVAVGPAHEWLFTPFDEALGHFRRYDRGQLEALTPPGGRLARLRYLDAVGIAASAGNRLFLKASLPTPGQLRVWDRFMVPVSRLLDPLLGYRLGKSVLAAWERSDERGSSTPQIGL